MKGQTDRHIVVQLDRQMEEQTDRPTNCEDKWTDTQTDYESSVLPLWHYIKV